ncbi:uncharacterized protein LOC112564551 [Pomacea canaliculata]|uniref:uncharacterized protein LOC112564551 n=1 Tax=Pomacea canaliculata TaxID=400727 RepID=UPI000D729D87|nr:uncharacterized protein LOC112564551 [Pomacea canaliculata]
MDGVFFLQILISCLNTLLMQTYSELVPRPVCCPQGVESGQDVTNSLGSCGAAILPTLRKVWKMDLNETFFISNILVEAITSENDSVSVDIGTTSCNTFQRECYVSCFSRQVVQREGCYVTINITCIVTNVKGRYVRVRQVKATALELCDVRIMGWTVGDRGQKNYALNAPCNRSSASTNNNYNASYAVDGNLGSLGNKSCSRSFTKNTTNHWWKVDFGKLILVSRVIITGCLDCNSTDERLSNFLVELGRFQGFTLCRNFTGVAEPQTTLNCTQSIWGRSLRISKTGNYLILCEVEVYGDEDNITREPVSDLTSDISCSSFIKSEESATSLETPDDNAADLEIPEENATTRETSEETATTRETSEETATTPEMPEDKATTREISEENATTRETPKQDATTRETPEDKQTTLETPEEDATTREMLKENATNRVTLQENSNPTTTKMVTAESIQKHGDEQKAGYCTCHCHFPVNKSQESLQQEVKDTGKELIVQYSKMSKQVRKKTSVHDKRLSSQAVGMICTLAISSIFAAIAVCDFCRLLHYVLNRRRENT